MASTIERLARNARIVDRDYLERERPVTGQPEVYVAGPVDEPSIAAAEKRLSLRFPSEYRRFVSRYGAMLAPGFELAGLTPSEAKDAPFFRDVVAETLAYHRAAGTEATNRYVLLSGDGMGADFLLDTAARDSCRILARGPGLDDVLIADGLDAFCDGMIEDGFAAKLNAASGH